MPVANLEKNYLISLPSLGLNATDPEAKALLEKSQAAYGMVPNMFANMANFPGLLETYMHGKDQLHTHSGFTPAELEVIFLTISRENLCEYCTGAHSLSADYSGVAPEITNALRDKKEIPDPKLKTLSEFTLALMHTKGNPVVADAEKFKAAGYTEKQMLAIILAISIKTISNFSNHIFQTPLDAMMASRAIKL
jgi:AhpD family alkylhydroperoxidase